MQKKVLTWDGFSYIAVIIINSKMLTAGMTADHGTMYLTFFGYFESFSNFFRSTFATIPMDSVS